MFARKITTTYGCFAKVHYSKLSPAAKPVKARPLVFPNPAATSFRGDRSPLFPPSETSLPSARRRAPRTYDAPARPLSRSARLSHIYAVLRMFFILSPRFLPLAALPLSERFPLVIFRFSLTWRKRSHPPPTARTGANTPAAVPRIENSHA